MPDTSDDTDASVEITETTSCHVTLPEDKEEDVDEDDTTNNQG